ncbi:DUF6285 domain-containing protein [Pseudomonas sp. Q1-7]|uniref:DUF6285 domain-containing protein n=1 Tax=Pseudomonas sp. Q1-7 TaxID=3020843 RepID=UPI002301CBDB|nr:DUF6285 domain-containing protein [Pseudomonas sp. Q1-7]
MTAPNATELLATARGLLLEKLLPALPASLAYDCRMVASAMAIAAREIERGDRAADLECEALAQVLEPRGLAGITRDDGLALLAQFIREGVFDQPGGEQTRLLDALAVITRAQLGISNPKVLNDAR